jgi:hypothetical protein
MPLAEKGARGKAAGLAPPQHTETRSAISAPPTNVRSKKLYGDFKIGRFRHQLRIDAFTPFSLIPAQKRVASRRRF